MLCDIFVRDCNIFLKPHPGDMSDYSVIFKDKIIIDKEMPSELTRFMINKNFDVGICTDSTSIETLKPYINEIYNIDDSIVQYEDSIFKLYFLYELAQIINYSVESSKSSLFQWFNNFYQLKGEGNIIFNVPSEEDYDILVKDTYFDKANVSVEIKENIEKSSKVQKIERLYFKIKDPELIKKIINFNFNIILPLSKVSISTVSRELNKKEVHL